MQDAFLGPIIDLQSRLNLRNLLGAPDETLRPLAACWNA